MPHRDPNPINSDEESYPQQIFHHHNAYQHNFPSQIKEGIYSPSNTATRPIVYSHRTRFQEALLCYMRQDFLGTTVILEELLLADLRGSFDPRNPQDSPMDTRLFAEVLLLLGNAHSQIPGQEREEACDKRYSECYEVIREDQLRGGSRRDGGDKWDYDAALATVLVSHSTALLQRCERYRTNDLFGGFSVSSSAIIMDDGIKYSDEDFRQSVSPSFIAVSKGVKHTMNTGQNTSDAILSNSSYIGIGPQSNSERISLRISAMVEEAFRMLISAKRLLENTFGSDRGILGDCYHNLGCCWEEKGVPSAALDCYMRSLRIQELLGTSNSAVSQGATHAYPTTHAPPTLSSSLAILDPRVEADLRIVNTMERVAMLYRLLHSSIDSCSGNIAGCSSPKFCSNNIERLLDAEAILVTVLEVRKTHLGPLSLPFATSLYNMGLVQQSKGYYDKANREYFANCWKVLQHQLTLGHSGRAHPSDSRPIATPSISGLEKASAMALVMIKASESMASHHNHSRSRSSGTVDTKKANNRRVGAASIMAAPRPVIQRNMVVRVSIPATNNSKA